MAKKPGKSENFCQSGKVGTMRVLKGSLHYIYCVLVVSDGQPSSGVRLQSDGQSAEGGAEVHPGHREADQEGRV